jgi:ring-1,2-phenylacetyl-CoA epoxidase subunit PaaC
VTTRTASGAVLPDLDTPRARVLLAIGDDALINGHRASHWTGVAPSLEEDLAFSTIAQGGINHADLFYQLILAEDHDGDLRTGVDAIGLGREPHQYRHAILCERPPRDFGYTLARHWITEHVDTVRLTALRDSSDAEVAALAVKLLHELRYHLEHADHWYERLARGGDEPRSRLRAGLADALPEALGLFEPVPGEQEAVARGLLPVGHQDLRERWLEGAAPMLTAVGFDDLVPGDEAAVPERAAGGRRGHHTADFTEDVWPEMTALYRAHPGARW